MTLAARVSASLLFLVTGLLVVRLHAPSWVFLGLLFGSFVTIIVTVYVMSWRQGHSGVVILPLRDGPFGWKGLKNKTNSTERDIVVCCSALIAGLIIGVAIVI